VTTYVAFGTIIFAAVDVQSQEGVSTIWYIRVTWSFEHYVEFVQYVLYESFVLKRLGGWVRYRTTTLPPLIAGFRSLDARPPAFAPSTHCRLEV
jgi:hypothetical protein